MGTKRLIDHDADTGESVWFESDGDDGFHLHHEQDCTPILNDNAVLRNTGLDAWRAGDDFRKEASIPNGLLMKWLAEEGIEFWKPEGMQRIVKKLNDPEYRYLKTADVRI